VRTADGNITTFDAPGGGSAPYQGSSATAINAVGIIAGNVLDTNYVFHGFVRDLGGNFTTIDAPGAAGGGGTLPISINWAAMITGFYSDANNADHGFLWIP